MTIKWIFVLTIACSSARHPNGSDKVDAGIGADANTDLCHVQDNNNGLPNCTQKAPPDSLQPDIQWTWTGTNGEVNSIVSPLVANLTDDNGDGAIDLCDIPEVVVVASTRIGIRGHIYVLDGTTGHQEMMIPTLVNSLVMPAISDIDHDSVPDIVALAPDGRLIAFDHTGAVMWGPAGAWAGAGAIALADLDHDGNVEIIAGNGVFDDHGNMRWRVTRAQATHEAPTAANLDGDRVHGSRVWQLRISPRRHAVLADDARTWLSANREPDRWSEPEILLTNVNGLSLIAHDGHVIYRDMRPTGVAGYQSLGAARRRSTTSMATATRSTRRARGLLHELQRGNPRPARCASAGAEGPGLLVARLAAEITDAWGPEADQFTDHVDALVMAGCDGLRLTDGGDRGAVLDRLALAERLRLSTGALLVVEGAPDLEADLVAAVAAGRTDLVAFARTPLDLRRSGPEAAPVRIGLIVPSSNVTVEREMAALLLRGMPRPASASTAAGCGWGRSPPPSWPP